MAQQIQHHSRRFLSRMLFKFNKHEPLLVSANSRNVLISQHRNIHFTSPVDKRVSFNLSDIGEGIREVTVKEWFVKEGDVVQQFDNLCEVQSDKASVTITSRYDGKILKLHHKIDEIALVGKALLDFDVEDTDGDSSSSDSDSEEEDPVQKVAQMSAEGVRQKALATPAVRRVAMEHKVDLSKVTATGKHGRVLKGDVLEYLNLIPAGTQIPHPTLVKSSPAKAAAPAVADTVVPIKGVVRSMFKSMTESLKIPHFAYGEEIEMSNLMVVRNMLKDEAMKSGVKLTFMPFLIKAASESLKQFPILNSNLDAETMTVHYKASHNVSVAIHTPAGLVVPNVKECQTKSILEIARELNELQERGQKGTLTPGDFANGTFSLSNIGVIGGTYTHPCIMPPQVAIGAVGKISKVPRFGPNDEVVAANIMIVTWCADHRIIDGVTMASFSNLWKNYLENPNLFMLTSH